MRALIILFVLVQAAIGAWAIGDTTWYLIPRPKKIELKSGVYNCKLSFLIRADSSHAFGAHMLADALAKNFHTRQLAEAANKIELIADTGAAFEKILKRQKLNPPFALGDEGYIIKISPQSILVLANNSSGVFYGVQTLIQLISANCKQGNLAAMVIYDVPDMAMRGWQDDISRGPIPTLSFLKEEIRRMASFKLNTFTLYTEHVFKLKRHPEIAPADGITEDEVKELVNFARDYHVEIIGNFQSFGHFENILKLPAYKSLGENDYTLSPAKAESYKFLADAYSEIAPAYSSKYFHINCDEVALGNGPSKSMIDSLGVAGVYACHINRIDSLLKPYHKKIMMWGDIAVHNPQIIQQLPRDMIIVCWNYGPMESMDEEILPFVKSGFQFIVAPGVNCWNRIYPDIGRSAINIYNFLRDGYRYHALGFINTTWDDDGQNLFNNNWYSLVWGADCGWNAPLDEALDQSDVTRKNRVTDFNQRYNRVYFETDKDITSLLQSISDLRNGAVKNCLSNSAIWAPLLPNYNLIPENYGQDNLNLVKTIDSLLKVTIALKPYFKEHPSEFELLPFALRQIRLVANKNLLGMKIKLYLTDSISRDINYFKKDFVSLDDTISQLKAEYGKLWKRENRNWWLDTVYSYYDSFAANLNSLKGACIIRASVKLIDGKRAVKLSSGFDNLPVYYTTDGTMPTINSTRYTIPIFADSNINIKARVIDNGRMYDVQGDSLIFHKGIGKLYKLNCKWSEKNIAYAARGKYALLDGRRGNKNDFSDGRWQGYLGSDINIELDLGEETTVSKITMGLGQLMRYGIMFPSKIEVSTSTDGVNYNLTDSAINTIDPKIEERLTHDYVINLNGVKTRYLKIVAKNPGPLPDWHYAKGQPSWLFADEIIVE
jgi:hexosaminidase